MTLSRPVIMMLLAATSVAAHVTAQQPGQITVARPGQMRMPPRDGAQERTGTARMRGIVVGGEAGLPLRRAVVRLFGEGLREGRVATTDADGRWELTELPAGRFSLSASKAGYVQLQYGQRRPFEQGRPIELADGQTLDNVSFNLPRGSVIAGRIVDEFGEPIAEATVAAMRYRYFQGRRRLVPVGRFDQTDDGGHFRVYGLAPGEYYLSATLRGGGNFGAESSDRSGYAPTYFPGTGSSQQAQPISVGLGAEMAGISFSLLPVRTVKVSGTAVDSKGKPMAGAFVMLMESARGGDFMMMSMGGGNRVRDDGTFTLSSVSPGEYTLQARPMGPEAGDSEVATAALSVGSEDITGVVLAASAATVIRGRVVLEGGAAISGLTPAGFSLMALAMNPDASPMMFGPGMRDRLEDDWSFELRAMESPALIRAMRTPPGWMLKSVTVNGQDVTDSGIAFRAGDEVRDVQVVLTQISNTVSGTVTDDRGQPVIDYAVVVFAEDPARWGPMTRYIRLARPDQSGAWQTMGLPPGRYIAAAVDAIENGEEHNPSLLERLQPIGTAFSLGEGEQKSVPLKVVQAY